MAMVRLRLLDVRCVKQQEMGGDEPYLMIRKNKVWSFNGMKTGMTISLRSVPPVSFDGEIDVTLMEAERFGRDDLLGSGAVTGDQANRGEQQFDFREKSCHYQVVYEVLGEAASAGAPARPAAAPAQAQQPPQQQAAGFGAGGGFPQAQPQQQAGGFGAGGGFPQAQPAGGFGAGGGFPQAQPGGFGAGGGFPQAQPAGFGAGGGFPQAQPAAGFPQPAAGFGSPPLFGGQLDVLSATSLWLALAFLVLATADGQVSEAELAAYKQAMYANSLPDPTQRFSWQQMMGMMNDGTLQNLSAYIVNVHSPERRNALIPIMLQIIVADGQAGQAELVKMQQVAGWIGAQVSFSFR